MRMTFFVPGVPVATGSTRSFLHHGKVITMQDNRDKQNPWAHRIAYALRSNGVQLVESGNPVFVGMLFQFLRPKAHYRGRELNLRADAPIYHTNAPDSDKLARCVFDALTGIAWADDRQAQITEARKIYSNEPGVWLTISTTHEEATRND